ncbi:hypothetical protein HMPREF9446_02355 [Bacteroides fluxus YIT 12057]|uniref:Uncharacterized protein n=1 Tax=Bacteroides fluxus YIT 12057 TaxID=763034 RepID=F3PUD3_9BACE|nr:hypothetical protein HMPREF9446_02355 [Bacteroides fluxus YIT 12057]
MILDCFIYNKYSVACKDNANRGQYKMNLFIFYAEVQLIFAIGKDRILIQDNRKMK